MRYFLFFWVISGFIFFIVCVNQNKPKLLVSGHRGASEIAPENTLAAILKCVEFGADFSELDVQETKDGEVVLLHDDDLKRTTTDSGFIWDKNWADLQKVDAGSWKSPEYQSEPIPLLETVIDSVRGKLKLNIELKINGHQEKLEERVVKIIEKNDFIKDCIITSFHREAIEKVKNLNPKIKVGLIFDKMPEYDVFLTDWDLVSVNHKLITKEFVQQAHQAGKAVHVWTVNEPELIKKMIECEVDCIITNSPEILLKVIRSNQI
jgi:glycerophosphoryl diester phosphodiesterase